MSGCQRLYAKLDEKLASKDYYEAHQLYRTIFFRLQRNIKYSSLLVAPDEGPLLNWGDLLQNRMDFIAQNESYTSLLNFLCKGAETLVQCRELLSALDLIKLLVAQLQHLLFQGHVKPGSANIAPGPPPAVRSGYYNTLRTHFDQLLDAFHLLFGDAGLDMVQNRSAQSKGFVENDFLAERDQLMEQLLQISKNVRVVDWADKVEMKLRNTFIRDHGLPEMHLRNGRLLMRYREVAKARHCFLHCLDAFELAQFLYFYARSCHNETEFELVLVRGLLRVFNAQLFLNAKPGVFRGQRAETVKRLRIANFQPEETQRAKEKALDFATDLFHYYLAIAKFFLLRQGRNATAMFRKCFLLKYLHYLLVLLGEMQWDTPGRVEEERARLAKQLLGHLRFEQAPCFASEAEALKFLDFFGMVEADPGDMDYLKVFHELRTNVYKRAIAHFRQVDRELDFSLLDRIFFVYYDDEVPEGYGYYRDAADGPGFFEPEETSASRAPPNLFDLLLDGGGLSNFLGFRAD